MLYESENLVIEARPYAVDDYDEMIYCVEVSFILHINGKLKKATYSLLLNERDGGVAIIGEDWKFVNELLRMLAQLGYNTRDVEVFDGLEEVVRSAWGMELTLNSEITEKEDPVEES